MNEYIRETGNDIPVKYQTDVVVVGGGIAGIAAALAAARNGKEVLLVEKQCVVGGLATSGLIAGYLPLCDGMGHQISFGIAEELLRLSIRYGAQSEIPIAWLNTEKTSVEEEKEARKKRRFEVQFNPQYLALLAEELLLKEHVHILYDTKICRVIRESERITELIAENKSGRIAIRGKFHVDATGDADLFWYAEAPTRLFSKGNILAGWYYYLSEKRNRLRPLGFAEVFDENRKNEVKPLIDRRFGGIDGQEISELMCLSHGAVLRDILLLKESGKTVEPTAISMMPQLRMTRCMVGEYELKEADYSHSFDDSVGMIADWRKKGMVYEIPLRSLYWKGLNNMVSAGRCICADDGMWDISRVIPPCAVTGEAAGTIASVTDDIRSLSYDKLSARLRQQGQKLNLSEVIIKA